MPAALCLLPFLVQAQNVTTTSEAEGVMHTMAIDPVPTCSVEDISCPACDTQDITNGNNSNYQVLCGTYLTASHITLQSGDFTPLECINACDTTLGCTGAHITDGGACSLAVGKIFGNFKLRTYTAFVSTGDVTPVNTVSSVAEPSPSDVAVTIAATANTVVSAGPPTPPAPYANNTYSAPFTTHPSTGPGATGVVSPKPPQYNSSALPPWYTSGPSNATNTTHPTAWNPNNPHPTPWSSNTSLTSPSYPNSTHTSNVTDSFCSLSTFSCPACNGKLLKDLHNTFYSVQCNTRLLSTSRYALSEPLSAAYCMSQCDERNATCVGASWSSDDGCVLAIGKINGTVADEDSTAFVRVASSGPIATGSLMPIVTGTGSLLPISTQPTWLNMSAYPTGAFTSARPPIATAPTPYSSASFPQTITRTSTLPAPPQATCNSAAIACPACDGLRIVDTLNTTYRLQCNFRPICDELVGAYGTASINVCMNRCDQEDECVGAVYDHGHCDLCMGEMDGEVDEDVGFLVLVPEEADEDGTATTTSVSIATPTPTPSPAGECNVTAMTCPACDGEWHTDAFGATYALDCDAFCNPDTYYAPRGMLTLDTCLASCDENADCVAASYDPYGCGQCSAWTLEGPKPERSHLIYVLRSAAPAPNDEASTSDAVTASTSSAFIAPSPYPTPWTARTSIPACTSATASSISSAPPVPWPSPLDVTYPDPSTAVSTEASATATPSVGFWSGWNPWGGYRQGGQYGGPPGGAHGYTGPGAAHGEGGRSGRGGGHPK